ncbi:MAG: hypothetical protein AAF408_07405 [Pseudomonadota bacterium]
MTTVKKALDRIARQCSIDAPTSWAGATRDEHIELRDDHLVETIAEIRDRIDLPAPIGKQTTITGTGAESYSLPSNYVRLQRDPLAVYETTTLRRGAIPVPSDGAWTHVNTSGSAGTNRYFKIEGYPGAYTIKFEIDLATGNSVTVSYISDVWVADSGGTESADFDSDNDVLLLPRRVVEMGAVWRYRQRKGFDFAVQHGQYEAFLSRLGTDSKPIRSINMAPGTTETLPMRVPVPDYIPSA